MYIYMFVAIVERGKKQFFKLVRYIPSVRERIDKELSEVNESFEKDAMRKLMNAPFIVELPKNGISHDKVLLKVQECIKMGETINKKFISFQMIYYQE